MSWAQALLARLVVEDAAEVVAVWEHVRLAWEIGAPRVHKVDARQPAGSCHLLQPQVLLRSSVTRMISRGWISSRHLQCPLLDVLICEVQPQVLVSFLHMCAALCTEGSMYKLRALHVAYVCKA